MYEIKTHLKPSGLKNVSAKQIDDHWKLYEGYVSQVNKLNEELKTLITEGKADSLLFADRRRRLSFEYNGMVLHEYYFENLKRDCRELPDGLLKKALTHAWGSYEAWANDFVLAGKTRGIGWAILYMDPSTKFLTNHFIAEHGNGHIAGYAPLLVMDVWEHAYMVDHQAGGRPDYITAFMNNINWHVVEQRFQNR